MAVNNLGVSFVPRPFAESALKEGKVFEIELTESIRKEKSVLYQGPTLHYPWPEMPFCIYFLNVPKRIEAAISLSEIRETAQDRKIPGWWKHPGFPSARIGGLVYTKTKGLR